MGRLPHRGAALTPALAATLAKVADVLTEAKRPWWVIGSAAVVLHGGTTNARDVDVIVGIDDVETIAAATGARAIEAGNDPLFLSERFLRWDGAPMPVEFMADMCVRNRSEWRRVEPRTRERIDVDQASIFVPGRLELRYILEAFGRPKDVARAQLLGRR